MVQLERLVHAQPLHRIEVIEASERAHYAAAKHEIRRVHIALERGVEPAGGAASQSASPPFLRQWRWACRPWQSIAMTYPDESSRKARACLMSSESSGGVVTAAARRPLSLLRAAEAAWRVAGDWLVKPMTIGRASAIATKVRAGAMQALWGYTGGAWGRG